ncbi:MAG: tetratricopeptide repeat protein [Terracidiphilus sp.]|jgi:tetratricopeptide (TPR) repeat protein
MERIEKTVFISYRRTNIPWALAIFQNLHQNGYDVFFDYSGIASGDFEQVILGNITARAHFLVLLTPSALDHCGEPGDWLRRQIETALDSRRNIVPLMLESFDFGSPKIAGQLSGKLAALKQYNGLSIPPDYFLEAMRRLRERFLNLPVKAVLHPASPPARRAAAKQKAAAAAAPPVKEKELTAQQWYERGLVATDIDERLRFYGEAIRLKPDYVEALLWRGVALHTLKGDTEGAVEHYNEAIRLKPDFAEAFQSRGIARTDKDDLEGALKDYNEAIRLKPGLAEAFVCRGNAVKTLGDLEGALKNYNQAIRLKPGLAEAFVCRGNTVKALGDLDGALKDYNEAIRLKPHLGEGFICRAILLQGQGDLEGALSDYDEAIRLKPDLAAAFQYRATTRDAMGDKDGARTDYYEATRLGYKPKA